MNELQELYFFKMSVGGDQIHCFPMIVILILILTIEKWMLLSKYLIDVVDIRLKPQLKNIFPGSNKQ